MTTSNTAAAHHDRQTSDQDRNSISAQNYALVHADLRRSQRRVDFDSTAVRLLIEGHSEVTHQHRRRNRGGAGIGGAGPPDFFV